MPMFRPGAVTPASARAATMHAGDVGVVPVPLPALEDHRVGPANLDGERLRAVEQWQHRSRTVSPGRGAAGVPAGTVRTGPGSR